MMHYRLPLHLDLGLVRGRDFFGEVIVFLMVETYICKVFTAFMKNQTRNRSKPFRRPF